MDHPIDAAGASPLIRPSVTDPADAMKGLFEQLLQSMTEKTEKRLADLLPGALEQKVSPRPSDRPT